jgi:hypothetical protein
MRAISFVTGLIDDGHITGKALKIGKKQPGAK